MSTDLPSPSVPPLVGALPPACRRDLEAMRRFVHAQVGQEELGPAVPPSAFREVFLTGATGFLGRFLLRDLLVQDEARVVHCLVRAPDSEQGLARVRAALQQAHIWNDGFGGRIKVVAGNLEDSRFGLREADFTHLCQRIDAVYHVAADVVLAGPYVNVRETNVLSLRQVLALCLGVRFKHLFFTSTLAVFPQYFCNFSGEFAGSRITTQMQPDLDSIKRLYPLGLSGYLWSKLTAEQVTLYAQRAGMPLAIFRLPLTESSTTGFPKAGGIKSILFGAMASVQAWPRGLVFEWDAEAADVYSKLMAEISLNSSRRYTIYHCFNPNPLYDELEPVDFGFYVNEVSYAKFKRLCRANGLDSWLSGLWPLIDNFGKYWFSQHEPRNSRPISDTAVRVDCPVPLQWPGLLTLLRRTEDWIANHQDEWPHAFPQSHLDFDSLVARGERYAERQGVASDEAHPEWMQTGLRKLVEALQAPEARLHESAKGGVVLELSRALRNSARLAGDRARYPDIAVTEIDRPVFIVGINRTGTTLLHRLLARDRRFRALRGFELLGSPLVGQAYDENLGTPDDPRFHYFSDTLEARGMAQLFSGLHHINPSEPEEDIALLRASFRSWVTTVRYHIPAYARWLEEADMRPPYRSHRSTLQHFAYIEHLRQGPQGQWLLKMPFHLMELDALIQAYPDALFIQTHRAPQQFMGSWNNLVARVRSIAAEPLPPRELGMEQLVRMARMMDRAIDFRLAHPMLEHRWLDISYYDMIQDPLTTVEMVYDHFQWNLEPRALGAMEDWLTQQRMQRAGEQRHRYDLADYGLTQGEVDRAFAQYRDFIVARGIHQSRL